MTAFPTDYASIVTRLQQLRPALYAQTRNYLEGAVTRLSPYLTHGVITLPQVREAAYAQAGKKSASKLVFELAWREFYTRVWWERGEGIFSDIKRPQEPVRQREGIPTALREASTGIHAIDAAIQALYEEGYVHNHARLWTAMLGTNIAHVHWKPLARWYYYHLLDGDLASNTLSWQWVAGSFSSKKYLANQENLNHFDPEHRQESTFLDLSYEALAQREIPEVLRPCVSLELPCTLPESPAPTVCPGAELLLYHPWSLDPTWEAHNASATRVLVLEPSHFAAFPVSPKRIAFICGLAQNIPGLQLFTGEVAELPGLAQAKRVRSLAHPATRHFPGEKQEPAWLFPQWTRPTMPGSFMGFWKEVERAA